jgi:hypothetical protein
VHSGAGLWASNGEVARRLRRWPTPATPPAIHAGPAEGGPPADVNPTLAGTIPAIHGRLAHHLARQTPGDSTPSGLHLDSGAPVWCRPLCASL